MSLLSLRLKAMIEGRFFLLFDNPFQACVTDGSKEIYRNI